MSGSRASGRDAPTRVSESLARDVHEISLLQSFRRMGLRWREPRTPLEAEKPWRAAVFGWSPFTFSCHGVRAVSLDVATKTKIARNAGRMSRDVSFEWAIQGSNL